ncbi:NAD(+) diphosphatase [Zavarzinia compransoris]|uniref:NAD(+) diphosphatase n=1 Tax=Zavarzinia marina TaxID=2911065 RepID=UPI001F412ED2|nr:NAD(+) diphosphatase [Zavarzinia marina]MCF4165824.1 NAD(+) diphosphatase [Zavarzinia marina]
MTEPSAATTFAGNPLDRAAERRKDEAWLAAKLKSADSLFLPLWRTRPFIIEDGGTHQLGLLRPGLIDDLVAAAPPPVFLGTEGDSAVFAVDVSAGPDPARGGTLAGFGRFQDMRAAAMTIDPRDAAIAAQAKAMVDWHARHRFCAQCGAPSAMEAAGWSRRCTNPDCGAEHFPRTDPVVIMLAIHGDRCLLGRQPKFPPGFYSALAGFVEPGETIEEAVRREVKEEAGIDVGTVTYHATQPWPFPSSLMVGCFAEAKTEAITVDGDELDDAGWFDRAACAAALEGRNPDLALPPPLAIAHHLVRAWVEGEV